METKTQKSALNETIKAEERKVMEDQATPGKKAKKPKLRKPMPAAKSTAKPASNVRPKKPESAKKSEKKKPKIKVIRDSFSMPEVEYEMIAALKKQCLAGGVTVKKSELLRAGLKALSAMSQASLIKHLSELPAIKTGRPAKANEDK